MAAFQSPYGSLITDQIQGGRAALGPDYLRSALRTRALRSYLNQRRRGDVSARLLGLDPAQARAAAFNTEQAATGNLTNSLNDAELADQQGYQNYIRGLLGGERSFEQQRQLADEQRRASRGTLGGFLGNAVGAFIPGLGAAAGSRLFNRRRQPQMDWNNYTPDFSYGQP